MEDKTDLILKAARARFERFGVKKTTMDEISRDVGISKKTLYEFFKSKEELFESVFIREALLNRDQILKKINGVKSPLKKIKLMIKLAVDQIKENGFMIQVLTDEDGLYVPYLKTEFRLQVEEGVLGLFIPIIEEGINAGEIRKLNPRPVAYFVFKLFQTFTYAKTDSIKGDSKDLEEMIEFILKGIAA